jgi:hypothetical protein
MSTLRPLTIALTLLAALALAAPARASQSVPQTAASIAVQLDGQLVERLQLLEGPARGTTLILSTPVDLGDLEKSSPLARLMGEELASWFVANGYRVQEVRRARNLMLDPGTGEMALSRDVRLLGDRSPQSEVLLAGTYSQTSRSVRFNIRLLHAPTGEVLAMASGTVQITPETAELLDVDARAQAARVRPSVDTAWAPRAARALGMSPWSLPAPVRSLNAATQEPTVLDFRE